MAVVLPVWLAAVGGVWGVIEQDLMHCEAALSVNRILLDFLLPKALYKNMAAVNPWSATNARR